MACHGAGRRFAYARLDDFKPGEMQFDGIESIPHYRSNVFISGEPGRGKTHMACALAVGWVRDSYFISTTEICNRIRQSWQDRAIETEREVLDQIANYPVLVIDDLGAERADANVQTLLCYVFKTRFDNGSATIVTSNLRRNKMAGVIDSRIVSVLNSYIGIMMLGRDRRVASKGEDLDAAAKAEAAQPAGVIDCHGQDWMGDVRVSRWLRRDENNRREIYREFLRRNARIGGPWLFTAASIRDLGADGCGSIAVIEDWYYWFLSDKEKRNENSESNFQV